MFKLTRKKAGMAVLGAVLGFSMPGMGNAAEEASWIERKKIAGFQVVSKGNAPEGYAHTSVRTLEKNPRFYMDRQISFDMYYGAIGTIYQPFPTGFHKGDWTNFYAWDINTQLWNQEQKRNICTTLYIHRENSEVTELLQKIDQYTPIRVYGVVVNDHDQLPWIEVKEIQVINEPLISPAVLRQLEDAYKQVANNNIDAASEDYKKALEMGVPVRVQVLVNRSAADIYLRDRKFSQAMAALNRVIELVPGDVASRLKLARLQLRLGMEMPAGESQSAMYAMALENARAMTYSYPNNPEGYAVYGLALAYNGQIAEGIENERFADERTTTGLAEAHANLARIAMLRSTQRDSTKEILNDYENANKEYVRATIQDPVNADYRLEHARVLVKLAATDTRLYSDAIEEYKLFVKFAPKSPIGYAEQAEAVMKENAAGAPQRAIGLYNKAIQVDSQYVNSYIRLAELYMKHHPEPAVLKPDTNLAKGILLEGVQNNPYSAELYEAMRGVGSLLQDDKYLNEAAARYIEKVGDAASYSYRGKVKYESLKKPEVVEALQSFRMAHAMDPENIEARKFIGRIYVRDYDLAGSVHALLAPAYDSSLTDVEFLCDWVESCLGVLDFDAANAAVARLQEAAPSDWRTQNLTVRAQFCAANVAADWTPAASQLQIWKEVLDQGVVNAGGNNKGIAEINGTRAIVAAHYDSTKGDSRSVLERYTAANPNDTTAMLAYSILLINAQDYLNAGAALNKLTSREEEAEISRLDRYNIERAADWRNSIAGQLKAVAGQTPTAPVVNPGEDPSATEFLNTPADPIPTPVPSSGDPDVIDDMFGGSAPSKPAPQPAPVAPAPQPVLVVPAPQPKPIAPAPQPTPVAPAPQPKPIAPAPQPTPVAPAPQPKPVAPAPQPAPVAPAPQPKPVAPVPQPAPVAPAPQPKPVAPAPTPTPKPTPAPAPSNPLDEMLNETPKPAPAPAPTPAPKEQDPQDMLDELLGG